MAEPGPAVVSELQLQGVGWHRRTARVNDRDGCRPGAQEARVVGLVAPVDERHGEAAGGR
jgi:hypothetical protein